MLDTQTGSTVLKTMSQILPVNNALDFMQPKTEQAVLTGDAKSKLEVLVVMRKVILLHLTHVLRKTAVVKCVMHAVV
jgi:hypothetical protein